MEGGRAGEARTFWMAMENSTKSRESKPIAANSALSSAVAFR